MRGVSRLSDDITTVKKGIIAFNTSTPAHQQIYLDVCFCNNPVSYVLIGTLELYQQYKTIMKQ